MALQPSASCYSRAKQRKWKLAYLLCYRADGKTLDFLFDTWALPFRSPRACLSTYRVRVLTHTRSNFVQEPCCNQSDFLVVGREKPQSRALCIIYGTDMAYGNVEQKKLWRVLFAAGKLKSVSLPCKDYIESCFPHSVKQSIQECLLCILLILHFNWGISVCFSFKSISVLS